MDKEEWDSKRKILDFEHKSQILHERIQNLKCMFFWLSNIAIIQGIFLVMKFSLNSIKFFEIIKLEAFSRCLIE